MDELSFDKYRELAVFFYKYFKIIQFIPVENKVKVL